MERQAIAEAVGYQRISWYVLSHLWRGAGIFNPMDKGKHWRDCEATLNSSRAAEGMLIMYSSASRRTDACARPDIPLLLRSDSSVGQKRGQPPHQSTKPCSSAAFPWLHLSQMFQRCGSTRKHSKSSWEYRAAHEICHLNNRKFSIGGGSFVTV